MNTLLILTLILLHGNPHHQPPPIPSGWFATSTLYSTPGTIYQVAGDTATINLLQVPRGAGPLAFITSSSFYNGSVMNKVISATISITYSGNPIFTFWGEGTSNNSGPMKAHCRLFITTNPSPYNVNTGMNNEDSYWWGNPIEVDLATLKGNTITITSPVDINNWSNANGHWAFDRQAGFNNAINNIRQVGLAFGGGNFFDVGCGVINGTGTATFHLINYTIH